jgi:hypothetical protein
MRFCETLISTDESTWRPNPEVQHRPYCCENFKSKVISSPKTKITVCSSRFPHECRQSHNFFLFCSCNWLRLNTKIYPFPLLRVRRTQHLALHMRIHTTGVSKDSFSSSLQWKIRRQTTSRLPRSKRATHTNRTKKSISLTHKNRLSLLSAVSLFR